MSKKKSPSTSRSRDQLVSHLYSDYFIRNQRLQTLRDQSKKRELEECQEAQRLARSNQVLNQRIIVQVKQSYQEMGLQNSNNLSFFNLIELMTRLNYVINLDDEDLCFLSNIWMNLTPKDSSLGSDGGINQRNLIVFLSALENIFVESMVCQFATGHKIEKQFGYFIAEHFYLNNEAEVKKVHFYFNKFYAQRQMKINHQKKDSLLSASSSQSQLKDLKFAP